MLRRTHVRQTRGGRYRIAHVGTVLIADDHASFRGLLTAQLESAGIRTIEAKDGQEALERAREADVVLLDVNLPDMSGYTVCRELRAEHGERLPIVFVSGYRTESMDRAAGLLIGGDDYVVKPPDLDELLARVRRLLERAQERNERRVGGFRAHAARAGSAAAARQRLARSGDRRRAGNQPEDRLQPPPEHLPQAQRP